MIYTFSYSIALFCLIGWFFFQNHRVFEKPLQTGFFISIIGYFIAVFSEDGALDYKFQIAFRDVMVLGVVGVLTLILKNNKQAQVGLFAGLGMVYILFFQPILENTFPQNKGALTTENLDPNGELLIELKEFSNIDAIEEIVSKYSLQLAPAFKIKSPEISDLDNYLVVDIPDHRIADLESIKEEFLRESTIIWVEENEQITVAPIESHRPTPIKKKYNVNDPELQHQWGFEAMRIHELYALLGDKSIQPVQPALIAILDTGVDAEHEDLKENYISTSDLYDKDVRGHGTHCAGIAAAVTNNGKGVASLNFGNQFVQITSIKVLMDIGYGTQRTIINGMLEAADNGAAVISMSLGGRSKNSKETAYNKAVEYARKKGAIVVAAAGNSNTNARFFAPANAKGVITVSAVDTLLQRASFSNQISEIPQGISAPGVQITSTFPKNNYKSFNGTSMATPYVSGLVGLMKSIRPELTAEEVYEILRGTGLPTMQTRETGPLIYPAEAVRALINK